VDATRAIAAERGVPMAQIALAWLLSKPAVTAPIIGATKMYQLDEALGAVDIVLSVDEIARLEASYRPHAVKGHA
jgi:aryl-alcohol dehydrogenase-like predicted oxidoreductase